ncbi:hypothetical protein R50072_21400 [Simiduia litorea]|uniref:BON domain-containing protein n=1 Tax=Simiduia litorea TaxID=1435348 RepID=UPI0036F32FE0
MNKLNLIKASLVMTLLAIGLSACDKNNVSNPYGTAVKRATAETMESPNVENKTFSLSDKVNAALRDDVNLRDFDIDVTASKGVITLTGMVDTDGNKVKIEDIVGGVSGVKSVVSELTIRPAS